MSLHEMNVKHCQIKMSVENFEWPQLAHIRAVCSAALLTYSNGFASSETNEMESREHGKKHQSTTPLSVRLFQIRFVPASGNLVDVESVQQIVRSTGVSGHHGHEPIADDTS